MGYSILVADPGPSDRHTFSCRLGGSDGPEQEVALPTHRFPAEILDIKMHLYMDKKNNNKVTQVNVDI